MEDISNVSSEEELLQLRDEGKISGAEYNDLLAAMRTPPPDHVEEVASGIDDARTKRKQGKTAFVLMFVGIIFPLVALALTAATPPHEHNVAVAELNSSQGSAIAAEEVIERQKELKQQVEKLKKATRDKRKWMLITTSSFFVLGVVFGIAAFVLGVISRPDTYGKATVTSIAAIAVIAILARLFVF
ncbi:MAG: hypothetical protein ISS79_12605 [Phycisphaerae bacterium]|nr:hypothetical protein [Phycisphaerae bacterium]